MSVREVQEWIRAQPSQILASLPYTWERRVAVCLSTDKHLFVKGDYALKYRPQGSGHLPHYYHLRGDPTALVRAKLPQKVRHRKKGAAAASRSATPTADVAPVGKSDAQVDERQMHTLPSEIVDNELTEDGPERQQQLRQRQKKARQQASPAAGPLQRQTPPPPLSPLAPKQKRQVEQRREKQSQRPTRLSAAQWVLHSAIVTAIAASPNKCLTVQQIKDFIQAHYPTLPEQPNPAERYTALCAHSVIGADACVVAADEPSRPAVCQVLGRNADGGSDQKPVRYRNSEMAKSCRPTGKSMFTNGFASTSGASGNSPLCHRPTISRCTPSAASTVWSNGSLTFPHSAAPLHRRQRLAHSRRSSRRPQRRRDLWQKR